jgi:hypothetical protein
MPSRTPARWNTENLLRLQEHFHALIRERARNINPPPELALPSLSVPLPREEKPAWFPVPGMYGGFAYWFEGRGAARRLVTTSWCRVVGGSGQRHEITADGCRLVEEGFV